MRIIAGEAKGRKLYAPGGEDTRPTADRIRESVFGILGPRVLGARVLDLFGGTGALALEALSRGAARATIVDSSVKAIACIRRNAEAVLGADMARAEIIPRRLPSRPSSASRQPFDLVFLDPPYRMEAAYGDALTRLRAARAAGRRGAGDPRTGRSARHRSAGGVFRPRRAALRRDLRGIHR